MSDNLEYNICVDVLAQSKPLKQTERGDGMTGEGLRH